MVNPIPDGNRIVMNLAAPSIPPPPGPPPPSFSADQQRAAAETALRDIARRAQDLTRAGEISSQISGITAKALETGMREAELALNRNFASEVHREGALDGRVRAQISSSQILRNVLSRTQRKQGEIPFAFDSERKIHTADPKDLPQLEAMPLPASLSRKEAPTQQQATAGNWVIVTRKDAASGMTFGIARPIGQRMEEIQSGTPPEVYLTLFIAILETESRTLRYVNAGHNPQFVLRADGSAERLESTGRPLGILPGAGYAGREVALKNGDSLFFYTDGLVETENEAHEEFGMERLEKLLLEERARGVEGILANVEKIASEFRGNVDAADDATMLLVRIGESKAGQA
jgi:hypothetical protein